MSETLSKSYGRLHALSALDLEVQPASVFALIGPNGAGKSTAIKILLHLIRAGGGKAELLGVDSRRLGAAELRQVGYVSENQRLPGWMQTGYFLDYCKGLYPSWDDRFAAELVEEFNLP
ncbi:MAG: ATP-binding cassette domain-containing protein [Acidimicrobiia bacterium]|nr:ATP-binding cassette domain-containing protein [Acidimicrobiia bacterium]